MASSKKWENYEQVAMYLLNRIAADLNLGYVEGKQIISGKSGTEWEIDAKGINHLDDGFVIIECKCFTKDRVTQEIVGGLAFRIQDTGASGGIIVTPIGYQDGAQKVADYNGITTVKLQADSTTSDYILEFLNKVFIGASDTVNVSDHIKVECRDRFGNLI